MISRRTFILYKKLIDYAQNSEDPDCLDHIELEYQDIINKLVDFTDKVEKIAEELNIEV